MRRHACGHVRAALYRQPRSMATQLDQLVCSVASADIVSDFIDVVRAFYGDLVEAVAAFASELPRAGQACSFNHSGCTVSLTGFELEHGVPARDVRRYQLTQMMCVDARVQ